MSVNAREEDFEYVELFGKPALFTDSRIDRDTVPEGWYCYDLRGSDDDPGEPVTVELNVCINHAGTILIHEPVTIPKEGFRRLKGRLDFLGEHLTLEDFCEERGLIYPEDTRKYTLRPASPDEAGLFYAHSLDEERELGAVGNIRIDFGHEGREFWHTWWPSYDQALNTPEFKAELGEVVDEMRKGVLKSLADMRSFCHDHGGKIDGGYQQNYGYVLESEHYRYCLRCTPIQGDYNAYLFAYDLRQQRMNMKDLPQVIARTSYANGEVFEHTDSEAFLKELKEELEYRSTSGFRYELLTNDPALCKAVDDILFDMFGEENPLQYEDYQPEQGMTMKGMM